MRCGGWSRWRWRSEARESVHARATLTDRGRVAEVVALNQHPSDEHEIGDWVNTIDDILGETRDVLAKDPECDDGRPVREKLLMLAAVAIAAAASMDPR